MRPLVTTAIFALFGLNANAAVLTVKEGQLIQDAVNRAEAGDTIQVEPGLYRETIYIDKDDIHLLGMVREDKWPVMEGDNVLNDGILVSGHGVTVENMSVRQYRGNAIMTQGSNNFKVIGNKVEGPGFYGIFPQYGKNGLVANNVISKISATGIYVGMSQHIDVLFNEVAASGGHGIELENCSDALVEGNYTHGNAIGITLNLIPGLPFKTQERMIVRNNFIVGNNGKLDKKPTASASPVIDTGAGQVPPGVGLLMNGGDTSTIENNIFRENDSGAIVVLDLHFGQVFPVPDPKVDPLPDGNRILGNIYIDNGMKPFGRVKEILAVLKQETAPSLLVAGKGRKNCILGKDRITSLGAETWDDCPAGTSAHETITMRLAKPVDSPPLTLKQKARATYVAVCTGCHSYSVRMMGPPMVAARAPYMGDPEKLAQWMAKPEKHRADYPAMPPQNYLSHELRIEIAKYILESLEP